jgi:NAD(P)-dependent dehydrogenase (short-subunit alcohol dehydrogenase family)
MPSESEDIEPSRGIFDLTGTVALVTGGNNGIGLAGATALSRAGASVAIWGRRSDRNDEAAEALRQVGHGVAYSATVDVSDPAAVVTGFKEVVAELGRVDCVFVNAGIADHASSFLAITDDSRDAVLGTNLLGAWSTIRAAVAHMVERAGRGDHGGSIIVNGSLAASRGLVGGEHYGAAKAALGAVVRGIAVEYGHIGVRANMICPGYIERDGAPGRFATELAKRGPIPRYGRPDEISGILVYLASDASSYHTGDVITVDGGWSVDVR